MKRKLILVLVLALVVSLFAGCNGKTGTPNNSGTVDPSSSGTPSASETAKPSDNADPTEPPAEGDDTPAQLFATDERGIATESYNHPLPLTTGDEVISYWTTIWTPEYITEEGGFGETALPLEAEKRTGVHVEYVTAPANNRSQAFSVLLAADDLCDIMTCAVNFYTGTAVEMVEEGYFVNILDYKEWMPNYLYESTYRYPDDNDTHERVFYFEDFVPVVYNMNIVSGEMIGGYCFRGDWLDQVGIQAEDIVSWDDLEDALTRIKVAGCCEFPMWLAQTLEMANYWQFNSFGSMTAIPSTALPAVYLENGTVQLGCTTDADCALMEKLSDWYSKGLINPNWAGFSIPADFTENMNRGEVAYQYQGATTLRDAVISNVDPNCTWVPVQKPLVEPDQVLHTGKSKGRTGTGNCSFSADSDHLELCMKWIDYRYSPEGYELYCYGPEGVVVYTDENGQRHNTDFAVRNPDGLALSWLVFIYSIDAFVDPGLCDTQTKLFNESGDMACAAISVWTEWLNQHYDAAGVYPTGARLTSEQSDELSAYRSNVVTYIAENFSLFMDGSKPLSEYADYQAFLEDIGLGEIRRVYQEAYQDYLDRLA